MFVSFFPKPRVFFTSAALWALLVILLWYGAARDLGGLFGMGPQSAEAEPVVGISAFWSPSFLWFYLYFIVMSGLFSAFWFVWSPHRWQRWSVLGSLLILFVTYFQVQVSVAINNWYGPFWDMIQGAVSKTATVTAEDFYGQIAIFLGIAMVAVAVAVMTRFFVSHYIFRWRTAMNEYYMSQWTKLRHIEGASQRVQEDTMRFSTTVEGLGVSLIDSVMTLIAFMPVLVRLSANVTELPLVGAIPYPLVTAAILWSLFGTLLLVIYY